MFDSEEAILDSTERGSVSQFGQLSTSSVEASDAALTAARRIGGQQSHVTKLLQQLRKLLEEEGEAPEILSLQSKVKAAYRKYLDAVQEFCGSLERDSEQYKRYMDQLQVRDREILEMEELVNVYVCKVLTMGSARSSRSSCTSRSKSIRSTGKAATHASTTLSEAARVRMDMRMAEINLAKVKRNEELKAEAAKTVVEAERAKVEAERAKVEAERAKAEAAAAEQSQRAILEAETDLAMARVRSEAVQGLLDLEEEEPLSAHEMVSQYVASLPQHQGVVQSVPPLQTGNEPLDCANPAVSVGPKLVTSPEVTTCVSQSLNVQATPWLEPVRHSVGLPHNDCLSLFRQSAPAPSSRPPPGLHCPGTLGIPGCSGTYHGSVSIPISAISFQPPGSLSSTSQGVLPTVTTVVAPMLTTQTTKGTTTIESAVVHGPAVSTVGLSTLHVPGFLSSEGEQDNIIPSQPVVVSSNFPTPIMSTSISHPTMSFTSNTNTSIAELAQVLVRCQGSKPLLEDERYGGDPLRYHQFMRQVEDRILNIYAKSDPGHALQLLLNSTTGRARKLIGSCIMLQPAKALDKALELLYTSFGSPAVAVKAHLKAVCEGPTIRDDERSLQDFYSDLVNCKLVVETANAASMLNSATTSEGYIR